MVLGLLRPVKMKKVDIPLKKMAALHVYTGCPHSMLCSSFAQSDAAVEENLPVLCSCCRAS